MLSQMLAEKDAQLACYLTTASWKRFAPCIPKFDFAHRPDITRCRRDEGLRRLFNLMHFDIAFDMLR